MEPRAPKILISKESIRERVAGLGRQISADFAGRELLCVGILRGAFIFLADLVREIALPLEVEFIRCSSYRDRTVSSGKVEIEFAREPAKIEGRPVLVVDDILDAGWTLKKVREDLGKLGAAEVRTCVLLDKPSRRATSFEADYRGFTIENHFVVGYGMDLGERYRNLPYIGVLLIPAEAT